MKNQLQLMDKHCSNNRPGIPLKISTGIYHKQKKKTP